MFPMSIHTAQPMVADRRHDAEVAAARHRFGRHGARPDDDGTPSAPTAPWFRISLGGIRRPLRRVRRGAVA